MNVLDHPAVAPPDVSAPLREIPRVQIAALRAVGALISLRTGAAKPTPAAMAPFTEVARAIAVCRDNIAAHGLGIEEVFPEYADGIQTPSARGA